MATLADSFLQDLDELDELDVVEGVKANKVENVEQVRNAIRDDYDDGADANGNIIDAIDLYIRTYMNSTDSKLPVVSDLHLNADFLSLIERVREISKNFESMNGDECDSKSSSNSSCSNSCNDNGYSDSGSIVAVNYCEAGAVTDEYELIESCNQTVVKLDREILNIHKFLRDLYSKKFPELDSIVYSPLEYIQTIKRLQNNTDLTKIDLSDLLPNTVIMAATVAASMTTGTPLPPQELHTLLRGCDEALNLVECRTEILVYLESRMNFLAPNLTAILGSSLTARLLSHCGGLNNLARMPSQNLMLVGSTKKAALGFSSATSGVPQGLIYLSELINGVPPSSRHRAVKYVCGKSSLAARIDSFHQSPSGQIGKNMREEIIKQLIKHQQPPPAPLKKTLPMPDEKKKSQRGGKRYRRMKEKYGISDYRKLTNRTKFGPEPEDEVGLHSGKGLGMLGKSTGMGRVKVQAKQTKVQMPQSARRRHANTVRAGSGGPGGSATVPGTASSLMFTPVQGIELCNPDASKVKIQDSKDKYFSSTGTFVKESN